MLDRLIGDAKQAGAICLKNQTAYDRTLQFDRVPREQAAQAFGKRAASSPGSSESFQDYIFWRLPNWRPNTSSRSRSTRAMPIFRAPSDEPRDLIQANPRTRFILFHGGFPWVGETGMFALKYPNVWVDISLAARPQLHHGQAGLPGMARHVFLQPIMWGSDMFTVEGVYATTIYTRQCITEALAEKVIKRELREVDAVPSDARFLRETPWSCSPLCVSASSPGTRYPDQGTTRRKVGFRMARCRSGRLVGTRNRTALNIQRVVFNDRSTTGNGPITPKRRRLSPRSVRLARIVYCFCGTVVLKSISTALPQS